MLNHYVEPEDQIPGKEILKASASEALDHLETVARTATVTVEV